jgi:hypothetical protein
MKEIKSKIIKRRKGSTEHVMQITPGKVATYLWTNRPCQGLRYSACMKAKTFNQQSPGLAKHGPNAHDIMVDRVHGVISRLALNSIFLTKLPT